MLSGKTATILSKTASLRLKTATMAEKTATFLDIVRLPAIRNRMMCENKEQLIEFFGGPADGLREKVNADCVNRPLLYPLRPAQMGFDGFGDTPTKVATYQADGSYTIDGAAIVRIRSFN